MTKKMRRETIKNRVRDLAGPDSGRTKLGYVAWWTIQRDLNIDGAKAIKPFKDRNFPEAELPAPLEAEVAFGRAIKKGNQGIKGWRFDKVYTGFEKNVYRVTRTEVKEDKEDIDFNKEDRITFIKDTGQVKLEKNLDPSKQVKKAYEESLGKIDNWRMIDFLLKQMKVMNTLSLRDMGGIYFIPIQYEDKLNLVEEGLKEVSPESVLYLLPIYKDAKAQNSLKTAFNEDFKRELESIAKELHDRIDIGNTRASTFQNRLTEYKELRERAKAYEDLLSFKTKDIHDAISKLENDVKEALATATE